MSQVLLVVVVVIVMIIAFSILFARPRTSCIDMYRAGARKALTKSNSNLYTASACAAFPLYSVTGTNIVNANIVYDYPSTCAGTSFVNINTPTLPKIVSAPTETTLVLDVSMAANTLPTMYVFFPNSTSTGVAQSSLTVSCNSITFTSGVNGSAPLVSNLLSLPALTGTRCLLVCALRANQVKLMYQTDTMTSAVSQLYKTSNFAVPPVPSILANITAPTATTVTVYSCKVYCTDVAISSTAAFDTAITANPAAPPPTTVAPPPTTVAPPPTTVAPPPTTVAPPPTTVAIANTFGLTSIGTADNMIVNYTSVGGVMPVTPTNLPSVLLKTVTAPLETTIVMDFDFPTAGSTIEIFNNKGMTPFFRMSATITPPLASINPSLAPLPGSLRISMAGTDAGSSTTMSIATVPTRCTLMFIITTSIKAVFSTNTMTTPFTFVGSTVANRDIISTNNFYSRFSNSQSVRPTMYSYQIFSK